MAGSASVGYHKSSTGDGIPLKFMFPIDSIKRTRLVFVCCAITALSVGHSQEIQKLALTPPADMTRADLYVYRSAENPIGVVVLCPGLNGNGESFLRRDEWRQFARSHNLGLVALSFASPNEFLNEKGRGYYYASKGSGQVLLDGIRKIYGSDLPVLLYGFSAGAHFTSRFAEWKPERVLAWCAYSAAWWDIPKEAAVNPPGIVACGNDDFRKKASFAYFKQGRSAGKPWLWINISKMGHSMAPQLETFARHYFSAVIDASLHPDSSDGGLWIDVDNKKSQDSPPLTGWLPDKKLFDEWKLINRE